MRTYKTIQLCTKTSEVPDAATHVEPVEIAYGEGTPAALISKAAFEACQNAILDAEFNVIMQRHGHTIELLTNR